MGWEDDAVFQELWGNVCMPAYYFLHCIGRTSRPVYLLFNRRHHLTSPLEGRWVILVSVSQLLAVTRRGWMTNSKWLGTWRVDVIWGYIEGGVVSQALRVAIFNAVHNKRPRIVWGPPFIKLCTVVWSAAVQRFGVYYKLCNDVELLRVAGVWSIPIKNAG